MKSQLHYRSTSDYDYDDWRVTGECTIIQEKAGGSKSYAIFIKPCMQLSFTC